MAAKYTRDMYVGGVRASRFQLGPADVEVVNGLSHRETVCFQPDKAARLEEGCVVLLSDPLARNVIVYGALRVECGIGNFVCCSGVGENQVADLGGESE